ncbi:septum site-determining protein Ssd [Acidipropionibacterium timonense]|uniref:septum site-determining protein Ssd n=1 Tax=Acidipropionibacterium timonense TaxID=2161818 RepID=UPI001031B2EF|nr:septum site-determining protein Ssd [Acidipropionibacterium timonense]
MSQDDRLVEVVGSVGASVGVDLTVLADRSAVDAAWRDTDGPLLIGEDLAAQVASWSLPDRGGVHLVGQDAQEVVRWSAVLRASVVVVPSASSTLAELLREGVRRSGRGVVLLLGQASGGLGASTMAAGVAFSAVDAGWSCALVELDPGGGGLDLLVGAERVDGWRWPQLASARGTVGDLRTHLPSIDGVHLVSAGRQDCTVGARARGSVVESLVSDLDLLVLDRGSLGDADLMGLAVDRRFDLVGADLRGLLAARNRSGGAGQVLLRRGPGRRMSSGDAGAVLGREPLLVVPQDDRLPRSLDQGEAPWVMASRSWLRACREVVEVVMGRG